MKPNVYLTRRLPEAVMDFLQEHTNLAYNELGIISRERDWTNIKNEQQAPDISSNIS